MKNFHTFKSRGCVPPLMGSGIYRSIQFSAFEATYTALDNSFGKQHVPLTHGIELRVILGGLMAGTVRALVETPLEYAKIKRQTESTWKLKDSFTVIKNNVQDFLRLNFIRA